MTDNLRQKTLTLARHPGNILTEHLRTRFHTHYKDKHPRPRLMFAIDLFVLGMLLGSVVAVFSYAYIVKTSLPSQIDFTVSVAPSNVRSGAPSTLVFSFTNTSEEFLRGATLTPTFPDHFLVQEVSFAESIVPQERIELGTIPPQGSGSLKVRGVMFGDVGGTQEFTSALTFRAGTRNRQYEKRSVETFTPVESALSIVTDIPERILEGSDVDVQITVANDGPVNFGAVSIVSERTDLSFQLVDGEAKETRENGTVVWTLPSLPAQSKKTITVSGIAPAVDVAAEETWPFATSFTFENIRYRQGSSETRFTVLPSPVEIDLLPDTQALTPGGFASFSVRLTNTSDASVPISEVLLEGSSPFFAPRSGKNSSYQKSARAWKLTLPFGALEAGQSETVRGDIPLLTTISPSGLSSFSEFRARVRAIVELGSQPERSLTPPLARLRTQEVVLPITSPVTLRVSGYYFTPQGDQLGRGPLPPRVGEETRYWVFWNIENTTNTLRGVEVRGMLPANVRYSGKHTQTTSGRLMQDGDEIVWILDELPPTFGPNAKTAMMGFELGVTPSEADRGTTPTLLDRSHAQALDTFTNVTVQAFGARATTAIPDDHYAEGMGRVE